MYIMLYSIFVLSILIITIDGETCPMRGDIRYDSSSGALQDALQVCEFPIGSSSLQWLYVCEMGWGNAESDRWCRQLGYAKRQDNGGMTTNMNSGEFKLRNIDCHGSDKIIIDCNYGIDSSACKYRKDVECKNCDNNHNQCTTPGTCNTTTGICECIGECMNGGYCYLGVCVCPADFTGSLCEDCNPACQNNGVCNSSGVCVCPYGYTGSTCETVSSTTTLMTTTSTTLTTTSTTQITTTIPSTTSTTQITTPDTTSLTQITTPDVTATQTTILTEATTYSTATAPTETSIPISTTLITNTTDSPPANGSISVTTLSSNTSIMASTTTNTNSITTTDTMIVSNQHLTTGTPTTTQSVTITATNPSNITQQSATSITEELNSSMGLVIGLTFVVVLFILFCIIVAVSAMVLLFIYRKSFLKKIKGTLNEPIKANIIYRNNTESSIQTEQPMKQLDPYYSSILNNGTSPSNVSEYEFIDPDLSMSADYLDFGSSITANVKSTHNGIVRHLPPVNEDYIYSNIDELTDDNAEQIYGTYINEIYVAFSESDDSNQDIYGIYNQISNPNENEAIVLNSNQREAQSFLGLSKNNEQEYEVMIAPPPPPKPTRYVTNNATTNAATNANVTNNSNVEIKSKEIYTEPPKSLRKLFDTLSSKKCREINPALLKMKKEVGSGAFGVVYLATWDSNYGLISVAVKQLKHCSEAHKIGIMQEAAIMRQFNHPNVLSLIGVVSLEEPYMIVTELMKGELKDILLKMKESQIDEFKFPPVLLKFTREIAEGMKHLSERGFIHRDLAARNVLVTRDLTCRIADFGMSRQLTEDDEYYKSTGGQIPLRWTAPEAVWYRRFSLSSDVWSFGMTMFEIWSLGLKPWLDFTREQIIKAFSNQQIHLPPTGCPKEVYRIMIKACNYEPEIRPNFIQICQMLQQPVPLLLKSS